MSRWRRLQATHTHTHTHTHTFTFTVKVKSIMLIWGYIKIWLDKDKDDMMRGRRWEKLLTTKIRTNSVATHTHTHPHTHTHSHTHLTERFNISVTTDTWAEQKHHGSKFSSVSQWPNDVRFTANSAAVSLWSSWNDLWTARLHLTFIIRRRRWRLNCFFDTKLRRRFSLLLKISYSLF